MISMTRKRALAAIALASGLALGLSACKVDKPANDKTPPKLRWSIHNGATGDTIAIAGSGNVTAKKGDTFTVTLIAEDPEGIHEIRMSQSSGWSCKSGNIGQAAGPSLGVEKVQKLNPDSQGKVLDKIFLIDNVDAAHFICQPGFQFAGGSIDVFGTGLNYANQKVTAKLHFSVPPG